MGVVRKKLRKLVRLFASYFRGQKPYKSRPVAQPFLRWAGGKRRLVSKLVKYMPTEGYGTYWEPFLGSAALFFALAPKKAVLADTNSELILCYKQVRENPRRVAQYLNRYALKATEAYYYRTRNLYNKTMGLKAQAARFIFLNRTGFNGIYRVNTEGAYNVPYGYKEPPPLPSTKVLNKASELLKNAHIRHGSYEKILASKLLRAKDFVYLDPPYLPYKIETANFTHYTNSRFGIEDHKKLAKLANRLRKKGCFVMISNSDNKQIRNLYKKDWYIIKLPVMRFIAANGKRKTVSELIITNYKLDGR